MNLDRLIDFYNSFAPDSVARFPEFYSADAWFKDPFNEVRGIPAIQRIFSHMFKQVDEPRFVVVDKIADAGGRSRRSQHSTLVPLISTWQSSATNRKTRLRV